MSLSFSFFLLLCVSTQSDVVIKFIVLLDLIYDLTLYMVTTKVAIRSLCIIFSGFFIHIFFCYNVMHYNSISICVV